MKPARLAGLLALAGLSLALGLGAGTVPLGPGEVWRGLWTSDAPASVIVRELRLPRVLLAFLVGGSLAVC
ncbi:MAG TPA: iron chelate uptake ABC transporter family permease subunit, partial [Gemmatimonadales bacterium]|nr:iron chelate uptake ABC transporter family permease subunit [Gemmatimonadales bacterium]